MRSIPYLKEERKSIPILVHPVSLEVVVSIDESVQAMKAEKAFRRTLAKHGPRVTRRILRDGSAIENGETPPFEQVAVPESSEDIVEVAEDDREDYSESWPIVAFASLGVIWFLFLFGYVVYSIAYSNGSNDQFQQDTNSMQPAAFQDPGNAMCASSSGGGMTYFNCGSAGQLPSNAVQPSQIPVQEQNPPPPASAPAAAPPVSAPAQPQPEAPPQPVAQQPTQSSTLVPCGVNAYYNKVGQPVNPNGSVCAP